MNGASEGTSDEGAWAGDRPRDRGLRGELLAKIEGGDARVGIIGLGYVGLPLAKAFADRSIPVLGFDVDPSKVDKLQRGESYIRHIGSESVRLMRGRGFEATAQFSRLDEPDIIIICVPTPLTESRDPDMTYLINSSEQIAGRLRPGQLVILESTTYPGTTRRVVLPILESGGLKAGVDFFLAFSPEREDPGNPNFSAPTIPKVVGGLDPASLELASALYARVVVRVVPVSGTEAAEACKILENTYRAVNIALVNELKILFDRMGIDVWEVIEAAKTKPFGFQPFYPGPGLGGHCLAGREAVRVRVGKCESSPTLAELFEHASARSDRLAIGDVEMLDCRDLEARSIDPRTGEVAWKHASFLFRRRYQGPMIELAFSGRGRLRVTEGHPMLVVRGDRLVIRTARDLRPGDCVPRHAGSPGHPRAPGEGRLDALSPDPPPDRVEERHGGGLEIVAAQAGPTSGRGWARGGDGPIATRPGSGSGRPRTQGPSDVDGPPPAPRGLRQPVEMILSSRRIDAEPAGEVVYSLEVPGTHTFETSFGIFVHNCIPIDPFYLSWVARQHGLSTRFIELAGEINTSMPSYVVGKVVDALNDRGRPAKGSRIVLLGMAYKRDIDDSRESPGFELMELLLRKGAEVTYNDPYIPTLPPMRRHPGLRMASRDLTADYLRSQDCVLIVTDHTDYDWPWIVGHSALVVDTRNATRNVMGHEDRIVRA